MTRRHWAALVATAVVFTAHLALAWFVYLGPIFETTDSLLADVRGSLGEAEQWQSSRSISIIRIKMAYLKVCESDWAVARPRLLTSLFAMTGMAVLFAFPSIPARALRAIGREHRHFKAWLVRNWRDQ